MDILERNTYPIVAFTVAFKNALYIVFSIISYNIFTLK